MTNDETGKPEQDSVAPEEENPKTWKMPEPVFRTSDGTKYAGAESEDLHETQEQIPPSPAKSSKMPFLLGGAFIIFFVATVFLAGIWFLFLRNIEPPKILSPEVEKLTPTPEPTAAPTETPAATPTEAPTPDPGGAPSNS